MLVLLETGQFLQNSLWALRYLWLFLSEQERFSCPGWKEKAALQWPAQSWVCAVLEWQQHWTWAQQRKGHCNISQQTALQRCSSCAVKGQVWGGVWRDFPQSSSPLTHHCRQNPQHCNPTQNRISNVRHQNVGCWAPFNPLCNNLPFLKVKLCSRARPSNQWLYLESPMVCIPGPFRSSIPCNQEGNCPVNRKELPVSTHLGKENVPGLFS